MPDSVNRKHDSIATGSDMTLNHASSNHDEDNDLGDAEVGTDVDFAL